MTELILGEFGGSEGRGFRGYREYVERGEGKEVESPLKRVVASTYLGSEDSLKRISGEYLGKTRIDKRNIPALKEVLMGPTLGEIEEAVLKVIGKEHVLFKKIRVYLCHKHSGLTLDEIGGYVGMKGGAVSQLSRRFRETIKRDKEMQRLLSRIEKDVLSNVET